jgi:hypothetical protein
LRLELEEGVSVGAGPAVELTEEALDLLPKDALLIAALNQPPGKWAARAGALAREWHSELELERALGQVPDELSALLAPGAFQGATLAFVRPGAAALPMGYLASRASPATLTWLAALENGRGAGQGALEARSKLIEGATCVEFAPSAASLAPRRARLALLRQGDWIVASDSAFSLKQYLRHRPADDPNASAASLAAELRADLDRTLGRCSSGAWAAGFARVRTQPLCEWGGRLALLAFQLAGAADLEQLPDPSELGHMAGDTTWVWVNEPQAIELRGHGLLGGLLLAL